MEKKPYTKPTIEKVELKPEEAALTACKTGGFTNGPNRKSCGQAPGPACRLPTS